MYLTVLIYLALAELNKYNNCYCQYTQDTLLLLYNIEYMKYP